MNLKNNFPPWVRVNFLDCYGCWICKMNGWDSLHHIVGRGGSKGDVENSVLNAAPLHNHSCHIDIHGKISTDEYKKKLLQKTFNYLMKINYKLNEKDVDFLKKYKRYYSKDQLSSTGKDLG